MAYKNLSAADRIVATHVWIFRDREASRFGGITQIGKVHITDIPTAATDGESVWYGEEFVMGLSEKQLRYVVLHESAHRALQHCTEYNDICNKYPRESNMAMDYVVNELLESGIDIGRGVLERPTTPAPLIDPKYKDHSWLEVLQDLLKNKPKQQQEQGGDGEGGEGASSTGGTLDKHIQSKPGSGEPGAMTESEGKELHKQIQDAIVQGQIISDRMRGEGKGGAKLSGMQERTTDWRTPLRKFISEICEGDDQSKFSPPNKRLLPSGIVLPSHYSEATGELVIACDTSGSMGGVYPLVFGEVARICQNAKPEKVRVIWWSDGIEAVQVFTAKDYDGIAKLLKPAGGGGTRLSCVAEYLEANKIKPRATIILTDGYIESVYKVPGGPVLWGIVDHAGFVPRKGKALHLSSVSM